MTEVLPPETKAELSIPSLEIAGVTPSALDSMRSAFNAFYVEAKKWETQAMAIKITSLDQTIEMAQARVIRLGMKKKRGEVEATHKALKEDSLRRGKAIDGFKNIVLDVMVPIDIRAFIKEQDSQSAARAVSDAQSRLNEAKTKLEAVKA